MMVYDGYVEVSIRKDTPDTYNIAVMDEFGIDLYLFDAYCELFIFNGQEIGVPIMGY